MAGFPLVGSCPSSGKGQGLFTPRPFSVLQKGIMECDGNALFYS